MNKELQQDSYRPILSHHEKLIEKYRLFLDTNSKGTQPIMANSSKVLNQMHINRENDNEENKTQQIDRILNALTAKKIIQEPVKEQKNKASLNIEAIKEKYMKNICEQKYKLSSNPQKEINPNEEIQRIKAKYLNESTAKPRNDALGHKYKEFLEDELIKYQQIKIEQMKPIQYEEVHEACNEIASKPLTKKQADKEDNSLLISKMSIFESQCDNQYQLTTNSKINLTLRNDETTQNNISYTYSKDSNENDNELVPSNENLDEVNYKEVNQIVQRMENLKKMEENAIKTNEAKPHTPLSIKEPPKRQEQPKDFQKATMAKESSSRHNSITATTEEKIDTNSKKAVNAKSRTQKPRAKLISFAEFLENDN